MQIRVFTIPMDGDDEAIEELNQEPSHRRGRRRSWRWRGLLRKSRVAGSERDRRGRWRMAAAGSLRGSAVFMGGVSGGMPGGVAVKRAG